MEKKSSDHFRDILNPYGEKPNYGKIGRRRRLSKLNDFFFHNSVGYHIYICICIYPLRLDSHHGIDDHQPQKTQTIEASAGAEWSRRRPLRFGVSQCIRPPYYPRRCWSLRSLGYLKMISLSIVIDGEESPYPPHVSFGTWGDYLKSHLTYPPVKHGNGKPMENSRISSWFPIHSSI